MHGGISWSPTPPPALIVITTAIAIVVSLVIFNITLWPTRAKILPSPLKTLLPKVPHKELQHLVYQPDQFPGARDIQTPVRLWPPSLMFWELE